MGNLGPTYLIYGYLDPLGKDGHAAASSDFVVIVLTSLPKGSNVVLFWAVYHNP